MFETKKQWEGLQEAARQNNVGQVKEIISHLSLDNKKKYLNVCKEAARSGASESLAVLLEAGGGLHFYKNWRDSDSSGYRTGDILREALKSPNPSPTLSVLYNANKNEKKAGYNKLEVNYFVTGHTPIEVIKDCLENKHSLFGNFLSYADVYPIEKLMVILAFTATAPSAQSALGKALAKVATEGNAEKAQLLLDRLANPDSAAVQALFNAAKGGHLGVVDLLLPHVKPILCSDIMIRLRQEQEKIHEDIIAAIEAAALRVTTVQPATPAPPQQNAQGYRAVDDNTLELNQTLSDGTRRVLYDFVNELREITVMTKGASAPCVYTVSFNDIKKEITEDKRRILDELNHRAASQKTLRLRAMPVA